MKAHLLTMIACGILNCTQVFGGDEINIIDEASEAEYIPSENIVALGVWNEDLPKGDEICLGVDWAACCNTVHKGRPLHVKPGLIVTEDIEDNGDEPITVISFEEMEVGVPYKNLMAEAKPLKKRREIHSP